MPRSSARLPERVICLTFCVSGISTLTSETRCEVIVSASTHLGFTPSSRLDHISAAFELISQEVFLPSNVSLARPLGSGIDVGIVPMNTPEL